MKKEDINIKLKAVLGQFNVDTLYYANIISKFEQKIEFLASLDKYNKLLKSLLLSKKINTLNSYIFEVLFAYDFESKGQQLDYEARQISSNQSSIDFIYQLDGQKKIYFELRLINQRDRITQSINSQLINSNSFEISLNGTDEKDEIARIQNLILSKCLDNNGNPIKFNKAIKGVYNFIVVYVSELFLGGIDRYDCILAMYGDPCVGFIYRRDIFGLYQQLPIDAPVWMKKYYDKFEHFRNTLHGVLFVKNSRHGNNRICINVELEYLSILNVNLLNKYEFNLINSVLSSFLRKWSSGS